MNKGGLKERDRQRDPITNIQIERGHPIIGSKEILFLFCNIHLLYLMTSIHHVLHAAQGIFSCGTRLLALAYGIYFPDQGSNQGPLHSKCGVLATGLPGKFLLVYFFSYSFFFFL